MAWRAWKLWCVCWKRYQSRNCCVCLLWWNVFRKSAAILDLKQKFSSEIRVCTIRRSDLESRKKSKCWSFPEPWQLRQRKCSGDLGYSWDLKRLWIGFNLNFKSGYYCWWRVKMVLRDRLCTRPPPMYWKKQASQKRRKRKKSTAELISHIRAGVNDPTYLAPWLPKIIKLLL